jgi:hypothetical protein
MNALIGKLQQWLPTLVSKKLGVAIMAFIAEFNTKPHQSTKQIVIAVLAGVYIAAQAYLDSKAPSDPMVDPSVDQSQIPPEANDPNAGA